MAVEKAINIIIKAVDDTKKGFTHPIQLTDLLKGKTDDLKKAVGFLKPAFLTAGATAATAGAVMLKTAIDSANKYDDLTKRTGWTTEALSSMGYAAEFNGSSHDELFQSIDKFNVSVVKAAAGTGEQAEAFTKLGISVRDSNGNIKDSEQLFYEVSDAFKSIPDGAAKAELATKLFSAAGTKLIPLLNEGSDGLRQWRAEADRMGQTVSGETAAAAAKFNDNLDLMTKQLSGAANQVAAGLAPALAAFTEQTDKAAPSMEGVVVVLKSLMAGGVLVAEAFNQAGKAVGGLGAVLAGLATGGLDGAKAAWDAYADDAGESIGATADRIKDLFSKELPAATEEGTKKQIQIVDKANQQQLEALKKRQEAERKAIDDITREFAKSQATKSDLVDMEFDERIATLRATYGETKAVHSAIEKLEYMRAERLEQIYADELDRVQELQRRVLEASGDKLAALEREHQAARDQAAREISDAGLRAEALLAVDADYAIRRREVEAQAADQAAAVRRDAAALERELRGERLSGFEAEQQSILDAYRDRLERIAELEENGLASHQAALLRIEAEKAADAALWQARMNNLAAFNEARGAAEQALTAGMLASYDVMFARQSAGEKALAAEKASVRSRIAAIEEQQLLARMTSEERAAYMQRKQEEELAALRAKEHELNMKRHDRLKEAAKALWVTFRDEFVKASVQMAARAAAQLVISKIAAGLMAGFWAPAATAASIATLGGAAAEGTAAYVGALGAGKAATAGMVLHGGVDFVPYDDASFLQRGERIVSKRQNEDLTEALERGSVGGGGPTQVVIQLDGEVLGRGVGKLSRDGRLEIAAKAVRS